MAVNNTIPPFFDVPKIPCFGRALTPWADWIPTPGRSVEVLVMAQRQSGKRSNSIIDFVLKELIGEWVNGFHMHCEAESTQ